jgi:hypothetical protein
MFMLASIRKARFFSDTVISNHRFNFSQKNTITELCDCIFLSFCLSTQLQKIVVLGRSDLTSCFENDRTMLSNVEIRLKAWSSLLSIWFRVPCWSCTILRISPTGSESFVPWCESIFVSITYKRYNDDFFVQGWKWTSEEGRISASPYGAVWEIWEFASGKMGAWCVEVVRLGRSTKTVCTTSSLGGGRVVARAHDS